ncbi:DUF4865 family protein [Streptomyces sp. NPDC090127]|uniref:DUF4865 family protein n=1 Tax=Streptomyces sp. NPDC090127 TaxID=3365953 RepID=UPI0037F1BA1F
MYAMQYEITLPADYDMGIIRGRVATRGHLLDDFPGLGLKAYLMREREDGSPVGQYAPFYLWNTLEGMNSFLWGPGFQGIVNDFGRPVVRHWTGLAYEEGPAAAAPPGTATRRTSAVPGDIAPGHVVAEAVRAHGHDSRRDGVVASALAIDPRHWELLSFTLWAEGAVIPEGAGERFQVLHLSAPERDVLSGQPTGTRVR